MLFLAFPSVYAKKTDWREEIALIKQQVEQIQEELAFQQEKQQEQQRENEKKIEYVENSVENLQVVLTRQKVDVQKHAKKQQQKVAELSQKISATSEETYRVIEQNNTETTKKIVQQENKVELLKNTGKKYVFFVWALLLGLMGILIFTLLKNKKLNTIILQLKTQIQKNKDDISLFFQEQINLCHQLLDNNAKVAANPQPDDFSLALKVADEITLMERNMSHMDSTVKGFKQLKRSIETLKDKLNSQGYEMPELLGKKFNAGMKLTVVSSFPSDALAPGEEVISKIIKPQVNYQGKMIQSAQVEVSIGE